MNRTRRLLLVMLTLALAGAGCTVRPLREGQAPPQLPPPPALDRTTEERILALDPERVTAADVRDTLAKGPTPRIVLLHGGIYPVHLAMSSFGEFLVGMGYPEARIRHPRDGEWSHSPYEDALQQAGTLAWYYERDGTRPFLIGHSQGGMQAVKILLVLAGEFGPDVPVWNPLTDTSEGRTAIDDPVTGRRQPVVGFRLPYASAVGAGGAAFLLPNQWTMVGRLLTIPDSVDEFAGYWIDFDTWAWTFPGVEATRTFTGTGATRVRNVTLPAGNNHVVMPASRALSTDPAVRPWIDAYRPGTPAAEPPGGAPDNALWVADVWYSVKKHWALEAQRHIAARRAGGKATVTGKLE
ncbi:MAG: hypothetical protein IPM22_01715 [Betaproteobacteria bacterium]|nr:hypothetical protein [Betaproteobacteria bacterium]